MSLSICVSQVEEHISLGICVSKKGIHISPGIPVSNVAKHISLVIRLFQKEEHISQGICVSLYCLNKKVGKMAIFEPKPLVNNFGKMSIFRLYELLVFIA